MGLRSIGMSMMPPSFSDLITEEFKRDYDLFSCGYIKHRQRILVISRERNSKKVAAKYRWLKVKYKSAWFQKSMSYLQMSRKMFNSKNCILEKLKKNSDFFGEPVSIPVKYK